jgi:hypothetical protein
VPIRWLVSYYAWCANRWFERFGIRSRRLQETLEIGLFRSERIARYFVGLGTLGFAVKSDRAER